MKLLRGRPEITGEDCPVTIYAALLGSIAVWNREMPQDIASAWVKTAQDAYETVQDGFGIIDKESEPLKPEGKALLYITLNQLEYALVGHGVHALENSDNEAVANVDGLLQSIDSLRT